MKNAIIKRISALGLALALSIGGLGKMPQTSSDLGLSVTAKASTIKVTGKYHQSDALKMLKSINSFRTGNDAWYWNESNTKKVKVKKLKKLTYD